MSTQDADQGDVIWVVDVDVDDIVTLPGGMTVGREAFYEGLWSQWGDSGLVGIHEGDVDTAAAAAAGLVNSPLVLDAAAAPADRDWVAALATTRAAAWFDREATAHGVATLLGGLVGCTVRGVRRERLPATDTDWQSSFTAIDVPGFGTVRPAWEPGEAGIAGGGATIFIEPGLGFGTGLHDTSRLCLAAIAAHVEEAGPPDRMLDFGSGSGILGIAAAVRGAATVDAVEIDAAVHEAIRANARRNGVATRVAVAASLAACHPPYGLVCANILAEVLVAHAASLCPLVRRPGGGLVLSGLLAAEAAQVADLYAGLIGTPPRITQAGDWRCLRFHSRTAYAVTLPASGSPIA
ncbi:MAG: 50S ribosomal protein L11 methyltransferase [Pirellulales bacterium]